MKTPLTLLFGLVIAGTAHADIVNYEFTATISSLDETSPIGSSTVSSSNLPGFLISVGDTLEGRLTLDTSTTVLNSTPSGSGTFNNYATNTGDNGLSAMFVSTRYTVSSQGASNSLGTLDQLPGQGRDALYLGTSNMQKTGGAEIFGLAFTDATATALATNHIPAQLAAFSLGSFRYDYTTGPAPHNLGLAAGGAITSLVLVSSVPEPASCAMLFAGLGLLTWLPPTKRQLRRIVR